jgi:type III secretion protein L
MVVWLRYGQNTVGVADGLIRAADFASLMATEDALSSLNTESRQLLENTQATCKQMLAATTARAEALISEAQHARAIAESEGMRLGREKALDEWTARAVDQAIESRAMLERQKLRLRDIVSLCVERLVGEVDRKALFANALKTISKLVQDVPLLTLRVHEFDLSAARAAVDESLAQSGLSCTIDVSVATGLEPGACLFESDNGVIDAGLTQQLQSVRRAVVRAMRHTALIPGASNDHANKLVTSEAEAVQANTSLSLNP